ncbi:MULTISPECIES: DUF1697 domain-containing protein [unclassified Microbacterium]|uniref:DUF1697 domain-containing protein n=1 Tax=unclassified Microbacterium TaxID=2609290 RepID=UPI00214CEE7C|nr:MULTISPECIES: DUF1697 domain-containing protein [unclassified Microbacterium]MCR2783940.1 DUF1697 domain-containing protein [Microbacterium sp. zg.B96]WIM15216.1 DUF1697 domain-containing protein [Microbacterium sp. zg-B96]
MIYAVGFLRNVNQGQRGHPSTADILAAFADAGAPDAVTFQSNGTVLFTADDPQAVIADAVTALAARTGLQRAAYALPFTEIERIVAGHADQPDASRREVSFHGRRGGSIDIADPDVVRVAAEYRCRILEFADGWAVSLNDIEGDGNGTPVIEQLTGHPATSRGLRTLARLVNRFGSDA